MKPFYCFKLFCLNPTIFVITILLIYSGNIHGQNPEIKDINFECDVVLDIYDAFIDWEASPAKSWGGSLQPKSAFEKINVGAVCLANKNDTDGSGDADKDETGIVSSSIGRNEIDLIKIVVRPRNGSISGDVTLRKVSGPNIRVWSTPTKDDQTDVDLPKTINGSNLPATFYVEALEESNSVRDMELEVEYGNATDNVKATAVWVNLSKTYYKNSDNIDLSELNDFSCVSIGVTGMRSDDGSYFGFSENFDPTIYDKLGGRILFKWQLEPANAYGLVILDGSRQKETKNWKVVLATEDSWDQCKFNFTHHQFPFDDGMDIEMPNDDISSGCEDFVNSSGLFYTYDPPNVVINQEYLTNGKFPVYWGYADDKTNFLEFVRVAPKGTDTDFNRPDAGNELLGSRGSDKIKWSNAYYTKKDETFNLTMDNTEYGLSHIRVGDETDDHTNYPIDYTVNQLNHSYKHGYYHVSIIKDESANEKKLTLLRVTEATDGTCPIIENNEITLPLTDHLYDLSFQNHEVELEELASFDMLFLNWHTFKSLNKLSELNINTHINNMNH